MIESFLDNDLYKFTMQQAVHALYPRADVKYTFINRGGTQFPEGFADELREGVDKMRYDKLTDEMSDYLKESCRFFTPVYLDFLRSYRFNPAECTITQDGGDLRLGIVGPWYRTILWEVPLMALLSDIYFFLHSAEKPQERAVCQQKNKDKALLLKEHGVHFADFGTRRRYSSVTHNEVIGDLLSVEGNTMVGTSNVHFARKYGIPAIGTMAHEWIMYHGAINGYQHANQAALDAWVRVYRGDLGIALTDTYTTEVFFTAFDSYAAKLFDGVRQDSGDPFVFADRVIAHYRSLGVDPLTKTIVFSDSLSTQKAIALQGYCAGKIKSSFGIGTHLTNDVGVTPLNMVIKLSHARTDARAPWRPTVKLSDDVGKHTGAANEVDLCQRTVERMLS